MRDLREDFSTETSAGPAPPDAALAALRAEADRLLVTGNHAIARALSPDSRAFLRAIRQREGE